MPDATTRISSGRAGLLSSRFIDEVLLRELTVPLGIIASDNDGIVTRWNEFATVLYGWTAEEAIGRPIMDLNVGPTDESIAIDIMKAVVAGEPVSGTFDCRRKDGSIVTINFLNVPILDDCGEIVGIVGFSREVVEQFIETLKSLDELRDLADHLDEVRRDEQQRIAAQLHDQLSQPIAMMATEALRVARSCDRDADALRFERIGRTLQDALRTLQSICTSLRPPGLDEYGPAMALETMLEAWPASSGVSLETAIDPAVDEIHPVIAEVVVQVVTEALANIERHAGATHAIVEVFVDGPVCITTVTDDGVGYRGRPGFGVRLMTERTRRVGGKMSIEPAPSPGRGTIVSVTLPTTSR